MAEIGLLRFARLAYEVGSTVLPAQRTRFSKRLFTQPQLLAVLCLMRFEDWTFREAEVRLSEHRELRAALELTAAPDHTTLYRFLLRLNEDNLRKVLGEIVRRVPRRYRRRARVAVDATGLAQNAISSFFVRRMHHHTQQPMPWRHWLKWLTVVDVDRQLILAQSARQAPWNDCANLPALVAEAHQLTPIGCVLADAEFDSERNHRFCREHLKAKSIIPAKRGKKTWKIHGVRAEMRNHFPKKEYGQRSMVKTVYSTTKRKLSCRAPGRSITTQVRQALLLGLAYNLYRLRVPTKTPVFERMSTEPGCFITSARRS